MDKEYAKELEKCFLILECSDSLSEFSIQMLSENTVPGLLTMERRTFNGEDRIYYDISGKQSLQNISTLRKLGERDLKELLTGLYLALQNMSSYFLNSSGLLLDPDCIFYEEDSYCFCYYPAVSEEIEKKLDSFAERLLGMTDHENEKAVVLVYAFYRLVKENNRTAVSVLQQLLEQEDVKEEENVTAVNTEKTEKRYSEYDSEEEYERYSYAESSEKELVQTGQKRTDITAVISFLLLSLGSMAAFFYFVWQDGNFHIAKILSEKQYLLAIAFFLLGIAGISVNEAVAFMRKKTGEKQAENTVLNADTYTENEDVTLT